MKKDIKKHIKETKFLTSGIYCKIKYNKYNIFFHLCWRSDSTIDIANIVVCQHDDLIKLIVEGDKKYRKWAKDNQDAIIRAIKKTRYYKNFQKRIAKECSWADKFDKTYGSLSWDYEVLQVVDGFRKV